MRVHILDDYFDTLRTLPSFAKLAGHDVTVWNQRARHEDELAEWIGDVEALVLMRERTPLRSSLIRRLPKLRLVSQRSVYPHIDVDALTNAASCCAPTRTRAATAWQPANSRLPFCSRRRVIFPARLPRRGRDAGRVASVAPLLDGRWGSTDMAASAEPSLFMPAPSA